MKGNKVAERSLKFVQVVDRTAEGLATTIRDQLQPFSAQDKLVAQTYDGAAVMSGRVSGVQLRLKLDFPHAKFVHCYSHQLNLILKQASSGLKLCRVFFSNLSSFSVFFSQSPKRTDKLRKSEAGKGRWGGHLQFFPP